MKLAKMLDAAADSVHLSHCRRHLDSLDCPGPTSGDYRTAAVALGGAGRYLDGNARGFIRDIVDELEVLADPDLPEAVPTTPDAVTLLRAWFHWFHDTGSVPALPAGLLGDTAAALTVDAITNGRSVRGPDDL